MPPLDPLAAAPEDPAEEIVVQLHTDRPTVRYEGSEACDSCSPVNGAGRTYCLFCGLDLSGAARWARALLRG